MSSGDPGKQLHIGSLIDEYGFHPDDFRILCRISRRGECSESVKRISDTCFMSERQVRYSLHTLIACDIISKEERIGTSAIYKMRPFDAWISSDAYPKARAAILRGDPDKKPQHKGGTATIAGEGVLQEMQDGLQDVQGVLQPLQGGTATIAAKGIPVKVFPQGIPVKDNNTARAGDSPTLEEIPDVSENWAVLMFGKRFGHPPPVGAQDLIAEIVTNPKKWQDTLDIFKGNGHQPHLIGNLVDRYKREVAKAEPANHSPPRPKAPISTVPDEEREIAKQKRIQRDSKLLQQEQKAS